jgi:uncharacterized membrane protein
MMLALSETRLLFPFEGITTAAWAVVLVGAGVAVLLFAHGLIGRLLKHPPEPILPWWQIAVGLVLAGAVALAIHLAAGGQAAALAALMIAVAASSAAWVLFFYLRLFTYLGRLPTALMLALRILAVVLLVLMIFKPTLSYEERLERRTDLYILLDDSRSMSVSDYPDTPNRLAMATRQVEQYLSRLETAFNVKLFGFSTRATALSPGQWPEPTGEATHITRAVKDVLASARRSETTAVILMSDGLHNSGGNVIDEVLAAGPPPIYTVGIGTDLTAASGFQDIAIENVRAPEEATVNNLARLTVEVTCVGLADRSVQVELREGAALVASEPLRLQSQPQAQSVTLSFTPTTVGRHTYTVRIPPDPAERRTENNERPVHLMVVDPKIRVLFIEGVVRPEFKPLKEALEGDPNVELLSLVQVKRGEFLQSGNMAGVKLTGFPQTLDDLHKFDVFIIGDVDRSYFSAPQMANLKAAVSEGRGLLMTGGYSSFGPGGYEGTAVEEILPVAVGPRTIGQETTPFVLKLTPEGLNHPIFTGTRDFFATQADAPKEKLPYLKGCNILGRPKPGASVLAVHPERSGPNGPLPVLVVQPYGKGRSAAFAADTTYQWYLPYRAMGRESPYTRFWGQMIRWLASKEIVPQSTEPGVTVVVLKPFYNPGEKITVKARVRAEEGRATNLATVSGVLMAAGGEGKNFPLALSGGGGGEYTAILDPPDPGQYRLTVEARKDGRRLGVDETDLAVGRPNQEFDRLGIDRGLLKKLSQATGGEYYEPANFGDLVERLRAATLKEDTHREVGLQTVDGLFGILFGVFLALVTGEWLMRKYYQLT